MESCSVCGAAKEPLALKCKYCGTSYTDNRPTGEEYINRLKLALEKIDQEYGAKSALGKFAGDFLAEAMKQTPRSVQARLDAINTFTIPVDAKSMMLFLAFCHGHASLTVDSFDKYKKQERDAWFAKAKITFTQLKMLSQSDTDIAGRLREYESFYGASSRARFNWREHKTAIGLAAFFALVIFAGVLGASSESEGEEKETARIERAMEKTQNFLANRQYEAALLTASEITWRERPAANDEKVAQYNQQREEVIRAINAAKERDDRIAPSVSQ
jgi:hypothetical protein